MADVYTILIVDDHPVNRSLIKKTLTKEGYIVLSAENGPDGRQLAAEKHPDLILLDIEMPGEDGFEVIEKLKHNPATATIPVLFLTGLFKVDVKLKGFELGAVDYITKPFHPHEVLARVRIHLKLSIATNSLVRDQARKLRQVTRAQTAMLPTPEAHPYAGFSVFYQALEEAGGDFYDILDISRQITGYFLADSSGHDIETSYITASVKALLPQNCTPVYRPGESMKMINDVLVEILPAEKYLTACYLHLNRSTRVLTLVNMGHPPVVVMPKGEAPFLINTQGDILGMFKDASFGIKRIAVSQGDRIFIYSDGLVESAEKKISWAAGVQDFLPAFKGLDQVALAHTPDALISRLFGEDTIPEDDLVILCIEV